MSLARKNFVFIVSIIIISAFSIFDLFLHSGRSTTFDSPFHLTNIAQYSLALQSGDFPVYWLNGFANFGLPIGIVAHQLPSYLGGLINLAIDNPVFTYNLLIFLAVSLSGMFLYGFLRLYFSQIASFLGVFLFTFAPYKILNIYTRGAEPEIFSNIFLPLILICIYKFVIDGKFWGLLGLSLSVFMLSITHPMNLLIYSFIFIPYILFNLWQSKEKNRNKIKKFISLGLASIMGIGMAGFYILPLLVEIKYFYIGLSDNQLAPNHYLSFKNFVSEEWRYFTQHDIFTRGHIVQTGIIEFAIFCQALTSVIWRVIRNKSYSAKIEDFALVTGAIILLLTLSVSSIVYDNFNFLGNIQFPWRMLNGFIFIPPILAAYLFTKYRNLLLIAVFVGAVIILRFPQLYGKNFNTFPESSYYFTQYNLHSDQMNTIWADKPENYPIKKSQFDVIGGNGKVVEAKISNSRREYLIDAKSPLRMVDYTFYFPGWNVSVNKNTVPIEFQDPNHRGLITYNVPIGTNRVKVEFGDTKVRSIAKLLTLVSFIIFLTTFVLRKRFSNLLNKL